MIRFQVLMATGKINASNAIHQMQALHHHVSGNQAAAEIHGKDYEQIHRPVQVQLLF